MIVHRFRGIIASFSVATILMLTGGHSANAQTMALDRFRSALIGYFAHLNYVPILVDRGYKVGDVVNVDGVNLYARSSRCFPGLKLPPPTSISLPDIVQTDSAGMSFGLRLKQIFDSSAGADLIRSIEIKFSDVSVISVAQLDLRDALDRRACPTIVPLIDGGVTAVDRNETPYFVVSEIIVGKRQATLELKDKASIEAKAKEIAQQIGDAQLKIEVAANGKVTLKSDVVSPIAMMPVTVPKVVLASQFGKVRGDDVELKWESARCERGKSCPGSFEPFAELVTSTKPSLSDEEISK